MARASTACAGTVRAGIVRMRVGPMRVVRMRVGLAAVDPIQVGRGGGGSDSVGRAAVDRIRVVRAGIAGAVIPGRRGAPQGRSAPGRRRMSRPGIRRTNHTGTAPDPRRRAPIAPDRHRGIPVAQFLDVPLDLPRPTAPGRLRGIPLDRRRVPSGRVRHRNRGSAARGPRGTRRRAPRHLRCRHRRGPSRTRPLSRHCLQRFRTGTELNGSAPRLPVLKLKALMAPRRNGPGCTGPSRRSSWRYWPLRQAISACGSSPISQPKPRRPHRHTQLVPYRRMQPWPRRSERATASARPGAAGWQTSADY